MRVSAWQRAVKHMRSQGCNAIHFVGIGGVGMRGLAQFMLECGFHVSGSDINPNPQVLQWAKTGLIEFFPEHRAENIQANQWVVYSSAISPHNPELIAAHAHAQRVMHRSHFLGVLGRFFKIIAVSGTHGKTTTAAMVTHILRHAGISPTYYIGADVQQEILAGLGLSDWFVLEADESDQSFLNYDSYLPIITNINYDHFENYPGLEKEYEDVFLRFANQEKAHAAVVCTGSAGVDNILSNVEHAITVGPGRAWSFSEVEQRGSRIRAVINGCREWVLDLPVPGHHMLRNALTAMAGAATCGLGVPEMIEALKSFTPMDRRFQYKSVKNMTVISDYGHHPLEIDMTIDTARNVWPDKKIVMAFEPHRFSRLKQHFPDFVSVLAKVDKLILLPVYGAGESTCSQYNSDQLAQQLSNAEPVSTYHDLVQHWAKWVNQDDVFILQGAGKIGQAYYEISHD